MLEHFLNIACKHSTIINRVLNQFGGSPLSSFISHSAAVSDYYYQQRDDLLDVVYSYTAPLLGESIAARAARDLRNSPTVLTANHHGVDFFSQSVQGTLLFSCRSKAVRGSATTVPVFSFGNIPLNNLTYPRGVLLYRLALNDLHTMPQKLPIFPDQAKRKIVSIISSFDANMIHRASTQITRKTNEQGVSSSLAPTLQVVFQEDYAAPDVLETSTYSQQSTILNARIWKRLFSDPDSSPDLVNLEIEKITGKLLELDLANPRSLAWRAFFDLPLREEILQGLDGSRGCWKRSALTQRLLCENDLQSKILNEAGNGSGTGTLFFWGVSDYGTRVPLSLEPASSSHQWLRGLDDKGQVWEIPYTPESIIEELRRNRLLPSLFTCFLELSFARGVTCVGGYYQAEYLPAMQEGLATALRKLGNHDEIACLVAKVPTHGYLSGMQAVMCRIEDNYLIPAGPIEIIAGGGLTNEDLEKILSLTVRDAHLASLFETIPDIAPWEAASADWKKQLAAACSCSLSRKVVIK